MMLIIFLVAVVVGEKAKLRPLNGQKSDTSNNGGPRGNNFGMINLIKDTSGWLKINDNNNINLPTYLNLVNTTLVFNIVLLNNNTNHNYN